MIPIHKAFLEVLRPAGFVAEHHVRQPGMHGTWRIDIAHVEGKVAIELDGKSHSTDARRARDRRKDAYIRSLGWRVIRIRYTRRDAALLGAA